VNRFSYLASQLGIDEPIAEKLGDGSSKRLVVKVFAVVETERLFVKVTEQMKRLHANAGSRNPALEETPKVL
jgi:hypothetical protein